MGGLPLLSPQTELYDSCQCDGMYSEHVVCRTFKEDHIFHSKDLRSYGVCYDAVDAQHRPTVFNHFKNYAIWGTDPLDYNHLCQPNDDRPRFIYLQGIVHYESKPEKVIRELIDPAISNIVKARDACPKPFKFHVLFTGGHAQSRWLDSRYPHQSREQMVLKNAALKEHIEQHWGQQMIDFWNLTRDAPSSDGLHHLTDVNLLKVQYVLNYLKHLVD
ncbi:hypothetical protein HDU85_007259 [Gaertneriomyces sp. JEL0708]|nr:hypothetical protein HDU85_007259 [Gaertneriomyces sp. JEL0708]